MKIQTNAGEVELTAEMVCRGMVLQSDHWIQNAARDGVLTMLRADPARHECWEATVDESWCYPVNAQRFLGCDPTIASRAACERYGVHGDAAAHGFARLRDGGAVDLRREIPTGAICFDAEGRRFTAHGLGLRAREGDRFLGLNAHYASPEDIKRLCCGAEETTTVTARGFAGVSPTGRVCTLAIGDHDTHEDLATGVKWSAGADFNANLRAAAAIAEPREWTAEDIQRRVAETFAASAVAGWKVAQESVTKFAQALGACPNCGGDDATCRGSLAGLKTCAAKGSGRATMDYMLPKGNGFHVGGEAPREDLYPNRLRPLAEGMNGDAGGLYVPAAIGWRNGSASLGQSQAHVVRDGDVCRWQVNHLGLRIRDGAEPHTFDAHDAAGRILFAVHDATAGIEWLAGFFGLLFRIHDSTPAAMRAKQEAPLVALVAAVPEGLDPIGWRAAVLALAERAGSNNDWSGYGRALKAW